MPDQPTPPHSHETNGTVNPSVRFETKDVSARGVVTFAVGLIAAILLTAGGMWLLLTFYSRRETAEKKPDDFWSARERITWQPYQQFPEWIPLPAIDRADHSRLYPLPRLEKGKPENPLQDTGRVLEYTIQMQIADEEEHLNSNGWVKGEKGVVHVPVEQAMTKERRRLNAEARNGDATEEFYHAPSRSSSGQASRRPGK
jgi:hypothetical protein